MFASKSSLRQARVLTVVQVKQLHDLLVSESIDAVDRVFVAYILIALYGRCRHSDLACVDSVHHDFDDQGGFLEIKTRCHKTSRTVAQKSQLLPILVPGIGVNASILRCPAYACSL